MPNDLASLLGDGDGATGLVRVREVTQGVVVSRVGEEVLVRFGNGDPIRLDYKTAITEAQHILMRSLVLPVVPIKFCSMKGTAHLVATDAQRVGQWMMAKGTEAKFLSGDTGRILYEVRR